MFCAGMLYAVSSMLVPRRKALDAYVAHHYPELCAYFPSGSIPSLCEMQARYWEYVCIRMWRDAYVLPSILPALNIRFDDHILSWSGLAVHGGNATVGEDVTFRMHIESKTTPSAESDVNWNGEVSGSIHDLREDRDYWPIMRYLPGSRMSRGVYKVSFYIYFEFLLI